MNMNTSFDTHTAFQRTIAFMLEHNVSHTVLEHAAEGRTEEVSALRGHALEQALKCMVLLVKVGKKHTRFVLAVVRGNQKVSFAAITRLFSATYVGFAQPDRAAELTGCNMGTVLPFSFHPDLEVIADESLRADNRLVYFNAGALDKSLAISARDYLEAARARTASIGQQLPALG